MKQQEAGQSRRQNSEPTKQPVEAEYETSPDAPYNRESQRPMGSANANEDCSGDRGCEIEKQKQYYDRGKK
ncbi:MAG: hypothetical protein QM775_21010 [Pirellulales bacterium]